MKNWMRIRKKETFMGGLVDEKLVGGFNPFWSLPVRLALIITFFLLCISGCHEVIAQTWKALLRATGEDRNLLVTIRHAWHVCSQRSFRLPLRMNRMHSTQSNLARFWPSITWNVHKVAALEEERFRSEGWNSPAFPNLWLSPVYLLRAWGPFLESPDN